MASAVASDPTTFFDLRRRLHETELSCQLAPQAGEAPAAPYVWRFELK
jgi:hypothetical protein